MKYLWFQITAAHLSSDVSLSEADIIYQKLCFKTPGIRLLYVTPEKVKKISHVIRIDFTNMKTLLYNKEILFSPSRFFYREQKIGQSTMFAG